MWDVQVFPYPTWHVLNKILHTSFDKYLTQKPVEISLLMVDTYYVDLAGVFGHQCDGD